MSNKTPWIVTVEARSTGGGDEVDPYDARVQAFSDWLRSAYEGTVVFGKGSWSATVKVTAESPVEEDWQAAETGRRYVASAYGELNLPAWPIIRVVAEREDVRGQEQLPQLVGIHEAAQLAGLSRQRLHSLRVDGRFPSPLVELSTGPIWCRSDVEAFVIQWSQRPGRPSAERRRFFVQHLDMNIRPNGANYTGAFHTFDEAQRACDQVWERGADGVRQEVTDTVTNEQWVRANGRTEWQYRTLNRSQAG